MLPVVVQPAQQLQQRDAQSIFPMGGPAGRCGAGGRFGGRLGSGPKPLRVLTVPWRRRSACLLAPPPASRASLHWAPSL